MKFKISFTINDQAQTEILESKAEGNYSSVDIKSKLKYPDDFLTSFEKSACVQLLKKYPNAKDLTISVFKENEEKPASVSGFNQTPSNNSFSAPVNNNQSRRNRTLNEDQIGVLPEDLEAEEAEENINIVSNNVRKENTNNKSIKAPVTMSFIALGAIVINFELSFMNRVNMILMMISLLSAVIGFAMVLVRIILLFKKKTLGKPINLISGIVGAVCSVYGNLFSVMYNPEKGAFSFHGFGWVQIIATLCGLIAAALLIISMILIQKRHS